MGPSCPCAEWDNCIPHSVQFWRHCETYLRSAGRKPDAEEGQFVFERLLRIEAERGGGGRHLFFCATDGTRHKDSQGATVVARGAVLLGIRPAEEYFNPVLNYWTMRATTPLGHTADTRLASAAYNARPTREPSGQALPTPNGDMTLRATLPRECLPNYCATHGEHTGQDRQSKGTGLPCNA